MEVLEGLEGQDGLVGLAEHVRTQLRGLKFSRSPALPGWPTWAKYEVTQTKIVISTSHKRSAMRGSCAPFHSVIGVRIPVGS